MRHLLILFFFASIAFSKAQTPTIQWQKCLGGTDEDDAFSIKQAHDKGFIVAGSSKSNDGNVSGNHSSGIVYEDYWVAKIDSMGTIQWQKSLGGTNKDVANSVYTCSNGDYVIAGYTESTNGDVTNYHGGVSDGWVACLGPSGNLKWQRTLGGSGEDGAQEIQQTKDKGFVVVSWSSSPHDTVTNHDFDYYIAKLDSTGIIQWEKFYGGSGDDTPYSVYQTSDGGYIVAGYSESNDVNVTGHHGALSARDCWIIKLDVAGNLKWEKSFGGTAIDEAHSIKEVSAGGYIFTGWSSSIDGDVSGSHGSYDIWTVKTDTAANILWQRCYGGSSVEEGFSIFQTSDKGFAISGVAYSTNGQVTGNHGGPTDFWLVKTDSSGNLAWELCVGGSNWDASSCVGHVTDGGYILTGVTASVDGDVTGFHGGNYDYWVVKLHNFTTGIQAASRSEIVLFPNPAKNVITFTAYSVPRNIVICDVLGRPVSNVLFSYSDSRIILDISNLFPGLYTLQAGDQFGKFVKE